MKRNEYLTKFINAVKGKHLVCFGAGVCLSQFINVYDGRIDLIVDNYKYGESIYIREGEKTICNVDTIKRFPPKETVVLITCDNYPTMLTQVTQMGYYHVFVWMFIRNFNKNIYDQMSDYMICHEFNRLKNESNIRIAHIAWHNGLNAGDHVLCHCVRDVFRKEVGNVNFTLVHVHDSVTEETIDILNQHDLILIGGGGLFLPNTNENSISGWQWACSEMLMKKIRKPMVVFAVGYNYFYGQQPNEIFKRGLECLFDKSDFFGLRNHGSIKQVSNLLNKANEKISYQPCVTTCISKYRKIERVDYKYNVALNLAMDYAPLRFFKEMDSIAFQVAQFCKDITKKGYKLYITLHCYDDWKFVNYLYGNGLLDFQVVDMCRMNPDNIIDFYSKMEIVISSRGHGQMIPFGIGVPILSLSTHPKMKYFIEDLGNPKSWYVDINDSKGIKERMLESFGYILSDYDGVIRMIEDKKNELWDVTSNNVRYISSLLNV